MRGRGIINVHNYRIIFVLMSLAHQMTIKIIHWMSMTAVNDVTKSDNNFNYDYYITQSIINRVPVV